MSGQLQLLESPPQAVQGKRRARATKNDPGKQYLLLIATHRQISITRAVISVRFGVNYHNSILVNTPEITTGWLAENSRLLGAGEQWEKRTYLQASSTNETIRKRLESFLKQSESEFNVHSVLPVRQTDDLRLLLACALEHSDPTLLGAEYRAQMLPQPEHWSR
ncbi:MAG: hypothetical protein BWY19_00897 [bacterium ADurb.Bin212]|nr:MAG: hypothetical protein BWY19_00897 [bacterium ADurb.Bin212]